MEAFLARVEYQHPEDVELIRQLRYNMVLVLKNVRELPDSAEDDEPITTEFAKYKPED
jgi:hypothetical protein